jgi:carbonic anhydrase/acetyltransferase-like protein (isoleucine patch superfamily)
MTSTAFHFEPIHTDQYVVAGDVVIAAGVAIAPGVLLQADVGSRIILGLGSCLGMGCVLHASGGEIRLDAGVNLGAGVLVVGTSTIGAGAIVGAGTTIMGESIAAGQLIAPNSLLANSIPISPPIVPPIVPEPPVVPEPAVVPGPAVVPEPAVAPAIPKVNTEGNGFFFSKKSDPNNVNDDPWGIAEPTIPTTPTPPIDTTTPIPNTFVDPQSSYFSGTGFSEACNFNTATGVPTESTFVYPDGNYHPKHPWEDNAKADLGNGSIAPPSPNPDSDLSAAEMQNGTGEASRSTTESGGYLVPQTPKQVYGQAYVNQMLGRMTGKKY